MAPNYKRLMPELDPLHHVINNLSDMSLPKKKLQRIGSRAESEARTLAQPKRRQLNNLRNSLRQQRKASLNKLSAQRNQLPQQFQRSIQSAIANANASSQKRGAVADSGLRLQQILGLGGQAQAQNMQNLGQIAGQQTQTEADYLANLVGQVMQPQRELAQSQGQTASKKYLGYVNDAKQALYKGKVSKAENLLNQAQREYNKNIQAAQNQYQSWLQGQQGKATKAQMNALRKSVNLSDLPKNTQSALATTNAPASYKHDLAAAVKATGMPASQIPAFNWIIAHESSFNPHADNPTSTAYGYGQFLDSTRAAYQRKTGLDYSNPVNQLIMTYQYMVDRYGSPRGAMHFWQQNHWY